MTPRGTCEMAAGEELITAHCPSHCICVSVHVSVFSRNTPSPGLGGEAVLRKPGALLLAQRRGWTQVPQVLTDTCQLAAMTVDPRRICL